MTLWPDLDDPAGRLSLERGRRTLLLHLSRPQWVYRRVESIEFVSEATVRRRISSDFALPTVPPPPAPGPGPALELLPLTLLVKRPTVGLDLRDEDGRPVPVLTRAQNGRLALELLLAAAELELGEPMPADVRCSLQRLVVEDAEVAVGVLAVFDRIALSSGLRRRVLARPLLRHLLQELAANFLLLTPIEFEAGRRRILKLAYVASLEVGTTDVAAQLGWRPSSLVLDVPTIGYSSSYHLEVAAPRGLAIVGGSVTTSVPPTEPVRQTRTAERVHFHVPQTMPDGDARAVVEIGVPRRGMLRAAAITAWAALLLLVLLAGLADRIDERTNGAIGAMLLLVPTLAAAYLVRPGEHVLVSWLLFGGRAAILLVSAVTLAAAATVAIGPGTPVLRAWLLGFVALAAVPTVVLSVALSRGVRSPPAPRGPEAGG